MDKKKAYEILGIDCSPENTITPEEIKKHYRMKALQYHPDKNKSENAVAMFQQVHSAYDYLLNQQKSWRDVYDDDDNDNDDKHENYQKCLFSFLKGIFKRNHTGDSDIDIDIDENTTLLMTIIKKITSLCENKILEFLNKIEKTTLLRIYEIMGKYQDVLHFDEELIEKVKGIIASKFANDECIILNPLMEDLMENRLYRIILNEYQYIIPLWHHELVYESSFGEIIVRCLPVLEENIEITDNNDIHIRVAFPLDYIWDQTSIFVKLCENRYFEIQTKQLKMAKQQTVLFSNQGIPRLNTEYVFDVSKKGHVYIHVEITKN
jgi:hypothetical protein